MSKTPAAKARPSRLGRGLSSLMQVNNPPADGADGAPATEPPTPRGPFLEIAPDLVDPNPHQPRKQMPPAALSELAASLRSNGIIQPLIVTRKAEGRFELIAGERRLRAAKLAKLERIPVVVREVTDFEQAQMALVENIQREDLNPIDRAEAYRTLQKELGLSANELAGRLGEDRSTIANYTRLLDLCEPVRDKVRDGVLPMGHAKVLAGVADPAEQLRLADLAISQSLTVRNLERLVKQGEDAPEPPRCHPRGGNRQPGGLPERAGGNGGQAGGDAMQPQPDRQGRREADASFQEPGPVRLSHEPPRRRARMTAAGGIPRGTPLLCLPPCSTWNTPDVTRNTAPCSTWNRGFSLASG